MTVAAPIGWSPGGLVDVADDRFEDAFVMYDRVVRTSVLLVAYGALVTGCASDPLESYLAEIKQVAEDQGVALPPDGQADGTLLRLGSAACQISRASPQGAQAAAETAKTQQSFAVALRYCDTAFAQPFTPEQTAQYRLDQPLVPLGGAAPVPNPGPPDADTLREQIQSGQVPEGGGYSPGSPEFETCKADPANAVCGG